MIVQAMHYSMMLQLQGGIFGALGYVLLILLSLACCVTHTRKQRFKLGLDVTVAVAESLVGKNDWATDEIHITLSDGQVVKARWLEKKN